MNQYEEHREVLNYSGNFSRDLETLRSEEKGPSYAGLLYMALFMGNLTVATFLIFQLSGLLGLGLGLVSLLAEVPLGMKLHSEIGSKKLENEKEARKRLVGLTEELEENDLSVSLEQLKEAPRQHSSHLQLNEKSLPLLERYTLIRENIYVLDDTVGNHFLLCEVEKRAPVRHRRTDPVYSLSFLEKPEVESLGKLPLQKKLEFKKD